MGVGQSHGKGPAIHDLLQRQNFIYLQISAHPCEAAQFLPPRPACKDERFVLVLEQQIQGKGRRRQEMIFDVSASCKDNDSQLPLLPGNL